MRVFINKESVEVENKNYKMNENKNDDLNNNKNNRNEIIMMII